MAACAANKKVHLAAALCLALVVAAAAEEQPATCLILTDVDDCARQIIEYRNKHGKLFSPDCCNELAKQMGCGCLLRKQIKDALNVDLQQPFCVDGSGCKN